MLINNLLRHLKNHQRNHQRNLLKNQPRNLLEKQQDLKKHQDLKKPQKKLINILKNLNQLNLQNHQRNLFIRQLRKKDKF